MADAFYERLMAGRPSPTSAELRELVASEPRQPATTLDVLRHSFPVGSEVVADDLLREAESFAVPTSRNAVHTALRRAVERGLAERVGRGRVRVLV